MFFTKLSLQQGNFSDSVTPRLLSPINFMTNIYNPITTTVCQNPLNYGFILRPGTSNYYAISDLGMDWLSAENFCQRYGAHLPIVRKAEDTIYLRCMHSIK